MQKKIKDAIEILGAAGVPVENLTAKRLQRVALALLAIANLPPDQPWNKAAVWQNESSYNLTTRQIIQFWNKNYGQNLSSGSYDDVRRKDLIYLVEACIAIRSAGQLDASTNNPTRGYAIAPEAGDVLRLYGDAGWKNAIQEFRKKFGTLKDRLERTRVQKKVAVTLADGRVFELSPGPHNELQRAIVSEFLPRFIPGAKILYLGDTAKKILVHEAEELKNLGFFELKHDALPDVVAYDSARNWLVLIEAVHSSNPISQLRHLNLEVMTRGCSAPRVYVSAFSDRASFRTWLLEISWETEVWLADSPSHLIHFNGDKFLGPHEPTTSS